MTIEDFKEPRRLICEKDTYNPDGQKESTKGKGYMFCKSPNSELLYYQCDRGYISYFTIVEVREYFSFEAPKEETKEQATKTPDNKGKIEVLDFILDQELDFASGLAIKHICKASQKPEYEQIEHLQKAVKHLKTKIKFLSQKIC